MRVPIGRVGRPHGIDGAFFVEQPSDDARWWQTGARFLAAGTPVEVVAHRRSSGRPVIIAIYTNHGTADAPADNAVVAQTASTLVRGLGLPTS